jgi:precorrin-6A/cobalt-precorrin-6A reductase
MTANAVAATSAAGVPLLVLRRPGWAAGPGDRWHRVPSAAAAAALLPRLGERVFLATGSGDLAAFAGLGSWFLLRAVDPPPPPLPPRHHLLLARGPFTADAERALLREHRIDVLVSRDSGGELTAAKLVAARELGLPVVLLARPSAPDAPVVATVEEAVAWLSAALAR